MYLSEKGLYLRTFNPETSCYSELSGEVEKCTGGLVVKRQLECFLSEIVSVASSLIRILDQGTVSVCIAMKLIYMYGRLYISFMV